MEIFTTNDGVKLAYEAFGEGRPVVLVAGYGAPAESWQPQIPALVEAGYRPVIFDRRSHGASENPAYGQRLARHAMDLRQLLEHLALDNPILIGQSMGASTIFAYLSLFGDDGIAAVVDIDQTPQMLNTPQWPHGMYGLDRDTMGAFFDAPLPEATYRPLPEDVQARLIGIVSQYPPFDMVSTRPLLLDHAYASWLDVLPQIRVPALFMAGHNSPLWPAAHAAAAAALCQNGKAVVINECGHAVNWEKQDECNRALLGFLADEI